MYDAELYRGKEEVERWKKRDPITTFSARLRGQNLLDDRERADREAEVVAQLGRWRRRRPQTPRLQNLSWASA